MVVNNPLIRWHWVWDAACIGRNAVPPFAQDPSVYGIFKDLYGTDALYVTTDRRYVHHGNCWVFKKIPLPP